ncbi:MAG: hypothetical protein OXE84_10350 [Rhodobacteraceae bacterium]|nr:hypothetical protein [Paracoccaceae bacterium]MCY4196777.1 hypothetical protein [Paracoccaceae bacterium]
MRSRGPSDRVTGPVGIGKTTLIDHLETGDPGKAGVRFARSLSVAKGRAPLNVLITALFLDMANDPTQTVSTQPERRERLLRAALKGPASRSSSSLMTPTT